MQATSLQAAISCVPAGRWAVGVSGGADSVALLLLLSDRPDLSLVVVHLDHQTRGRASIDDATFVAELATRMNLPVVTAKREQIEPHLTDPPANPSALYRALRLELFRQVVREASLQGVLLAHHADDQAETVLHRLLRNASVAGLAGMAGDTVLGDLRVLRPLLEIRRQVLRDELVVRRQPFCDDASNASDDYFRNRLRRLLADYPAMVDPLLELSRACAAVRKWTRESAPALDQRFSAAELLRWPTILARESGKRWLEQFSPIDELSTRVVDRLLAMTADAAGPRRRQFPGRVTVRRRRGMIEKLE